MRLLLLISICAIGLAACRKAEELSATEIQLGAKGPIRGALLSDTAIYLCGGATDAQGELFVLNASTNEAMAVPYEHDGALYDLAYAHGKFVALSSASRKFYAESPGDFYEHWVQPGDWLPELHQQPLRQLAELPDGTLFAVGGGELRYGMIQRSTDSLGSWQSKIYDNELRAIYFTSNSLGFAGGNGLLLKTTDAGDSWFSLELKHHFITGLWFEDEQTGLACTYNGKILRTTDGGETWKRVHREGRAGGTGVFAAIGQLSSGTLLAVGNGVVCRSNNGTDWVALALEGDPSLTGFMELPDGKVLLYGDPATAYLVELE